MSALLGLNAKCYWATARATWGTVGTDGYSHEGAGSSVAGLTLLDNIKDLSLTLNTGEADVSTRGNGGWNATLATLKNGEISFDMVYDTSDTGLLQIQKCFFTNANLPLAVLDGVYTTVGTRGLWIDAMVTKFDKAEALADAQMVSVTLKPGYSSVDPEWVKVTA